jgi:DNA-binding transcriptional regulator YiaG
MMAKKFQTLRNKMTPEQREKSAALTQKLLSEMPIHELRHALALSQEQLAEALDINQAAVSKLEHRTDMLISTLRRYIEAMGGELEVRANFPEGSVSIPSLGEIQEEHES